MGSRAVLKVPGVGSLWVESTDRGISRISFRKPRGWSTARGSTSSLRWISLCMMEFSLLGRGVLSRFTCPADLASCPPFTRKVLTALGKAPRRTLTYAQLARLVGSPKAARAVGSAMARNPVPVLIPCHLVLATGGGLGGFSGGLAMKKRLLALEIHS